ncbi:MAG: AAA family ATPase [Ruminococcus sp.]|nr:AAA family ATPase [Ruminococcus sp.]
MNDIQKPLAEIKYREELDALIHNDKGVKPNGWLLSPKAVRDFILGAKQPLEYNGKKIKISQKFFGDDALVERAIVTLASNRGLMLVGEPGTAKTMLSELLSAAVCGNSANTVQGTAGTTEDNIKYSWNYAMLLAKGPVKEALVPSPVYTGMKEGIITRFEEVTRCPLEIQDTLISVMSDRVMNIPELGNDGMLFAKQGFNIIATANTRDKGINEMSSALKRRFNFETVEPVKSVALESRIIKEQCRTMFEDAGLDIQIKDDVVDILAETFSELRSGQSYEKAKIQKLSGVMSTAEAVAVYYQSALSACYYGNGEITMQLLTENLLGSVVKENKDDLPKLKDYYNGAVKLKAERTGGLWKELYNSRTCIK